MSTDCNKPLNHYERKQQARRDRYEERAEKARVESDAKARRATEMADCIPFGQPVQVGHHSEHRDRRFRRRIGEVMTQAVDATKKAEYYEQKAASVGMGGVSSDDPDAVQKLKTQLEEAEAKAEKMKAANKAVRKGDRAALAALGFSEKAIDALMQPDFAGRLGFPAYALSNNRANITRIRKRIAELEAAADRQDVEEEGNGYTYREDTDENRVMFLFDGKPNDETRNILKRHAFKWSPSRGAWVRHLNNAGIYSARCVRAILDQKGAE
ncbi:DUF3560 domain-containing protein [Komagataeibacter europaeus]|uniref:DUF3560 domain-containing protein n=1 Tax=Komagataeibacter europaeus TaxID=33995 RepID=UPI0002EA4469|nr:DUF3560 domain-containing protein [Komagataeibacter europaeus]GBQ45095.1 hypothetical protein AA18890_2364 [Komagataeibacter europaeus LMG 18890]